MLKKILLYQTKPAPLAPPTGILPLVLLSISGLLDKEGYEIVIVNYDDPEKESKLCSGCEGAICVAMGSMTGYQITDGLEVAKMIRGWNPSLPIVWGGWHPTLMPAQTLENRFVDIVVRGQGERAFYDLVKALESDSGLGDVKNISYKKDGQIVHNEMADLEDPNNFPTIPYHLVDVSKFVAATEYGKRTLSIFTSVGCPYACTFCAISKVCGRKWKSLELDRVLREVRWLKENHDVDSIKIVDGDFFVDLEHSKKVLRGFQSIGVKAAQLSIRVDQALRVDDELWRLIASTGVGIIVGVESGRQSDLDLMNKMTKVEDAIKVVKRAQNYGIEMVIPLIIGLPKSNAPGQLADEFNYMLDYILELHTLYRKTRFFLFIYTPYPGTPLYEKAISLGFVPPGRFEDWAEFSLWDATVPWVDKKTARRVDQMHFYYLTVLNRVVTERVKRMMFPFSYLFLPVDWVLRKWVLFKLRRKWFSFDWDARLFKKVTELVAEG